MIELIVYMVIAAMFLIVVSAVFINGWISQKSTSDRDIATGRATIVTSSIQQSLRNAQAPLSISADGKVLKAIIVTGDSTWVCQAWGWDGSSMKYVSQSSAITTAPSTWSTTLATGISQTASSPIFSATTGGAAYSFTVTQSGTSVSVSGGAVAPAKLSSGSPSC